MSITTGRAADGQEPAHERRPVSTDALADAMGELHGFIAAATKATPTAGPLWAAVERSTIGGKMLRPRMLVATHRALGGSDHHAEARAAAAFELLHTAFLIHDDVIDHDWVRRGEPNVAGSFRASALLRGRRPETAEHLGTSAAIIAGDLAIGGAMQLISSASTDREVAGRLTALVAGAVSATAAGELMDVELASSDRVELESVIAMYEAKTSVYTFCAPLQAGAILARASDATVAMLAHAGRALGVAYQITDDVLGLFGDPAVTGKSVISDAREGKRTVLAVLLAERGVDLDRVNGEQTAARLRDLVERSGARFAAIDLATAKAVEAEEALASISADLHADLQPLLTDLTDRIR